MRRITLIIRAAGLLTGMVAGLVSFGLSTAIAPDRGRGSLSGRNASLML